METDHVLDDASAGARSRVFGASWTSLALTDLSPGSLPLGAVLVLGADLDSFEPFDPATLAGDERDRAVRLVFPRDRRRFIVSRCLLRETLGRLTGVDPRTLRFAVGAHGKPRVESPWEAAGVHWNLSHSKGGALLAFSRERNVGVDLEAWKPEVEVLALAERFFTAGEAALLRSMDAGAVREGFYRIWTRKEALVKGLGVGLAGLGESGDVFLESNAAPAIVAGFLVADLPVARGFSAALAVEDVAAAGGVAGVKFAGVLVLHVLESRRDSGGDTPPPVAPPAGA